MGVSLNKLLRATVVLIEMLILFRLSFSHAVDVETHTQDKVNHRIGQSFAASCSIEICEEEREAIIESDGDLQLGVKMLDCTSKFFVPNARKIVPPWALHQCQNIPAQNVSCRVLSGGSSCWLYMLTWVVIPGDYLSRAKNYSFACYDINNLHVLSNCPARAFHISVTQQTTEDTSPSRSSRDVRSHSIRYTTPSSILSTTTTTTTTTTTVTVTERMTTHEKVKDHSTTINEKNPTKTVEIMDTGQNDGVGAFVAMETGTPGNGRDGGNGAARVMWHPFKLSELFLCTMLVELLTRR